MLSPLRNRFGIPGVISVIALVFAMLGGAYAATNPGGGSRATTSAKGKPGPRGKPGKPGPAGPQGPAGPAGPAGAKGDTGANGSNGSNGTSATTVTFGGNEKGCEAGGVEVKSASAPVVVCNGKKGSNGNPGAPGQPWVPDNTLPAGATLTGAWAVGVGPAGGRRIAIPFTIPLAEPLINVEECGLEENPECEAHFIDEDGKEWLGVFGEEEADASAACDGTAAEPTADPGHLCIYTGAELNVEHSFNAKISRVDGSDVSGASTVGAFTALSIENNGFAYGSWAVTAEE